MFWLCWGVLLCQCVFLMFGFQFLGMCFRQIVLLFISFVSLSLNVVIFGSSYVWNVCILGVCSVLCGYMKQQFYGYGIVVLNRCIIWLVSRLLKVSVGWISVIFCFVVVVCSSNDEFWNISLLCGFIKFFMLVVLNYGFYVLFLLCSRVMFVILVSVCGRCLLLNVGLQIGKNILLSSFFMYRFGQLFEFMCNVMFIFLCVKLISVGLENSFIFNLGWCLMKVLICGVSQCVVNDGIVLMVRWLLWLLVCNWCVVWVIWLSVLCI